MKDSSKSIGGLLGPAMLVIVLSEFPLVQPDLYDAQIPPVVYLSGALMFVAGLAIVRAHNHWVRDWSVLITAAGWFFLVLGVLRMFFASAYLQQSASTSSVAFLAIEGLLILVALVITIQSYSRH